MHRKQGRYRDVGGSESEDGTRGSRAKEEASGTICGICEEKRRSKRDLWISRSGSKL